MSWHVISTLQRMLIFRAILRNKTIEYGFHVNTNIRVCILIDAQSATCMFTEYVNNTCLRQLGQLTQNLTGHQMESARLGL